MVGWNLSQAIMDLYPDIASEIRLIVVGTYTNTRIWTHSIKEGVTTNEAYASLCVAKELKS